MVSDDVRGRLGRKGRLWNRVCRECGDFFTTRSPKGYYCRECQRVRRVLQQRKHARRYERKARNSGKDNKLGTFGKRYLEVVDGRIRGAMMLQEHVGVNSHHLYRQQLNGSPPVEYETTAHLALICLLVRRLCLSRSLICEECKCEVIVARHNEHYTIPTEITCEGCGLVYDPEDLAELNLNSLRVERRVREDPVFLASRY